LPFQVGKLVQTYGDWISDDNEGVQDGSRAAIRALSAVLINHSPALNIVLDAGAPPLQAVRDNSLVNVTLELLSEMMASITDELFFQQGGRVLGG
jgi:hypothetical protein